MNHIFDIGASVRKKLMDGPNDDLLGKCAIASMEISRELSNRKIPHTLHVHVGPYDSHEHAFITMHDQYIIDVTATQFKHPDPVIVKDINSLSKRDISKYKWKRSCTFYNVKDFKKFLRESGWPKDQIFKSHRFKNR